MSIIGQGIEIVANGSAITPATTIVANPSINVNNSGLITATASATQSVTPTVNQGYISSGTAGTITVSGSNTQQLTTQGATTYHPSLTDQTIVSGKYLTGTQTINRVKITNLDAADIKYNETVQIGDASDYGLLASVTGTFSGASTVSSGQIAAAAAQIRSGYSAWVNGVEVQGSLATYDGTVVTS